MSETTKATKRRQRGPPPPASYPEGTTPEMVGRAMLAKRPRPPRAKEATAGKRT